VLKEFNLLATTYRRNEGQARSELRYLLKQIGDDTAAVERTGVSGLIAAKTALDPFDVIRKLREILREHPYEFRYMLRVIPIEKVVRTSLEQVQEAVKELGAKIEERETFRVTIEKRFTETPSKDIIEAAAATIKRKVNLNKPDKILLVEVVGGLTGLSITEPDGILSVLKEKVL
jgi:tRNA acetyltransferase TAN1